MPQTDAMTNPPSDPRDVEPRESHQSAAAPQPLIADPNALLQAQVDAVLVADSGRSLDELAQLAALQQLPPLTDEELARQAEAAPGADNDPSTPE